jgi:hypothetical protein
MRARMSLPRIGAAVVIALLGAACTTTPTVTLQANGSSPAGSFSGGLAQVPEGIVLGFKVNANTSAAVTATIDDTSVASVVPTTTFSQFVIIGLVAGQTNVHVFVADQEAAAFEVQVTSPAL